MQRLIQWLSDFNKLQGTRWEGTHELTDDELERIVDDCRFDLENQYRHRHNPDDTTNNPFRPSALGKPALVVAYNYYHPGPNKELPSPNARLASIGYFFESWLTTQIIRLGYTVHTSKSKKLDIDTDVSFDCHIDLLVTDDNDTQIIIECKEVNDYMYKQWVKWGKPDDERGYITQASLYSHAFDLPILWVIGNRVTGEIAPVSLDPEDKVRCLCRAQELVHILVHETYCWEDCFEFIQPEPPNITKKGLTVPFGMKSIADKVYELDKKGYVLDYKYPPGMEDFKPTLIRK